jgi:hypothetical protein
LQLHKNSRYKKIYDTNKRVDLSLGVCADVDGNLGVMLVAAAVDTRARSDGLRASSLLASASFESASEL